LHANGRLIRRNKAGERMLGDKAYDSAEREKTIGAKRSKSESG
jgi:hypothetical protein